MTTIRNCPQQAHRRSAANPHVVVERDRQFLWVEPRIRQLERLTTTDLVVSTSQGNGFSLRRAQRPLFDAGGTAENGYLRFPIGLEAAVLTTLHLAGYEIETRTVQGVARLAAPVVSSGAVDPQLRSITDWIYGNARGILQKHEDCVHVSRIVKAICDAFPAAAIAVVARDTASLHDLAGRLRPSIQDIQVHSASAPLNLPACDSPIGAPRLLLCTPHGLDPHYLCHTKIVLWLRATDALHEQSVIVFDGADRARMYGLLAADRALTASERDGLYCRFGFEEFSLLPELKERRDVQYCFLAAPAAGSIPAGADALAMRQSLEGNPARNRIIVSLARQLVAGNLSRLPAAARQSAPERPSVTIVVGGLAHAIRLAGMLDGWGLSCGDIITDCLSARQRQILADHCRTMPIHWLVTLQGLERFDLDSTDILVRADGGSGGLPTGSLINKCTRGPLLVVDVANRHHPVLRRWKRQRETAYQAAGWARCGSNPAADRIREFIQRSLNVNDVSTLT